MKRRNNSKAEKQLNSGGAEDFVRVFVSDTSGPPRYVGFFEDTGETGDLYVSDRKAKKIVHWLQIYVSRGAINVSEDDVQIIWSKDGTKCGAVIWGGMRGIIDVSMERTKVAPITDSSSAPIVDPGWLEGFEI